MLSLISDNSAGEVATALYDCYTDAAAAAFHSARYADACECLERAAEEARAFPDRDVRRAYTLNALGIALFHTGRFAQADEAFRQALVAFATAGAASNVRYAVCIANRATTCVRLDRVEEAEQLYGRALDIAEKALGADDPQLAWELEALGSLQAERGADLQAGFSLHRALRLRRAGGGPWELSVTLKRCAEWMSRRNHPNGAEGMMREALSLRSALVGEADPSLAPLYAFLGRVYASHSNYADAEWVLRQTLTMRAAAPVWDTKAILADIAALKGVFRALVRQSDVRRLDTIAAELQALDAEANTGRDGKRKERIGAMLNWFSPSPRWV